MLLARSCSDTLSHGSRQPVVRISGNSKRYPPDLDRVRMRMARAASLGVSQDPQDLIEGGVSPSLGAGTMAALFRHRSLLMEMTLLV
ncbi:hypothetical protein M431DRAFT_502438 [Trichoderma harzianum CBS 226.95]|uniref:Uncharacterized protein n=1 Tax=Trichoderma harzianum CBS 226.95 TaxID=983964 RepID=A0A2T4ATL3_TRIHA|nr:hypothetical protein M431DRAFT_502438 [Trichoderma harzianum CBS 226.95]PTB60318.1 hypothetical protein M431DRAFT_502438 [Trichoderma harzianum CBS 226.95]